MWVINIIIIL